MTSQTNRPTNRTYASLEAAYDHFNSGLFDGALPPCLITVQRHKGSYGYFSGDRFASTTDPVDITDEIALNPQHFASRTPEEVLSTLAHEMAHLWQHRLGKPPRKAYHDRQWAAKMREIGLVPSATGQPGGKETGQKMTHYIEEGGRFAVECAAFLAAYPAALYQDRAGDADQNRKKKAASKTKFTCPDCAANAWGKPELHLICGGCQIAMEAEAPDEEDAQTALQADFGQAVREQGREVLAPGVAAPADLPSAFAPSLSLAPG